MYMPRLSEAGLQPAVLLFATMITAIAAIVSGLAPALRVSRIDLQSALRDTASGLGSGRQDRLRRVMVGAEIALTVIVLAGAGLLLRSAIQLASVPLGFDAHNVLVARLSLPPARYGDGAA